MQQKRNNLLEKSASSHSSERDDLACRLQKVTEERDQALSGWREMYDKACSMEEGSLDSNDAESSSKTTVVSTIGQDDLLLRLQDQFEIVPGTDQLKTCENDLYDAFMTSQEPHLHEEILDQLFGFCHNGERMPEKERKRRRSAPGCRSCKHSFSVCLRAIGGVARKIDKQTYWLNIRQKQKSSSLSVKNQA
jgi:hypothetical protein